MRNENQIKKKRGTLLLLAATLVVCAVLTGTAAIDRLPLTSEVNGLFEQAKQLTSQRKFDEAIVKAEEALAKLKQLRDASKVVGAPDLVVVSVTGDGDQGVTVIVQNKGTANVPQPDTRSNIRGFQAIKVRLYLIPTGGGQPREIDSTGMMILDGLNPGEAKPVRSRAMGCGLTQKIIARVDAANEIPELDENNNESVPITVKSRPCGS